LTSKWSFCADPVRLFKIRSRKKLSVARRGNSEPDFVALPEYYVAVVPKVIDDHREEIKRALLDEPANIRREFANTSGLKGLLDPASAWTYLRGYLDNLESRMRSIAERHSPFYWLHLYRRLGVRLAAEHSGKTDAITLAWVRKIAETAFLKFGALPESTDVAISNEIPDSEIFGGLFKQVMSELLKDGYPQYLSLLGPQWVIRSYSPADHVDLFRVEGLAYEYWHTMAKLRAIGKGASLHVIGHTEERSDVLSKLIKSYDSRIEKLRTFSSTAGISTFRDASRSAEDAVIFASYNVTHVPLRRIFPSAKLYSKEYVTNFLLGFMDTKAYVATHSFISQPFRDKNGFAFETVLLLLLVASHWAVMGRMDTSDENRLLEILRNVLQRGYVVTPTGSGELANEFASALANRGIKSISPEEIRLIIASLSLTDTLQKRLSLWTGGPRPLFIPYKRHWLFDLAAIPWILETLFVGVRYDATARGYSFEQAFRDYIAREKFELLPNRVLRNKDGLERETDAAIRVGTTLILCDCRTIERPLDYEIGSPRTINRRNQLLNDKLTKIISIRDFVATNRVGRNYDFSWAKTIYSIGVSPFVEWVWSDVSELWLDTSKDLPLLLSVDEARALLDDLRRGPSSKLSSAAWRPRSRRKKGRK